MRPSAAVKLAGMTNAGNSGPSTGTSTALDAGQAQSTSVGRARSQEKKTTAASAPSSAPELSEAQEAQRSSQILKQLRMRLHPGLRSATIQLAPAHLGRLSIRVTVDGGEVHAIVRAESEEALAVLQKHVPELEAAFADQGFEDMSFEFMLDQQTSDNPEGWTPGQDVSAQLVTLVETQIDPALRARQTLSDLGVDTYA